MFHLLLKKYRKINKITQTELATSLSNILNSDVSLGNIASWERGTNPKLDVIVAIAEILDIPEQFLFDDSPKAIAKIIKKESPNFEEILTHTKKVSLINGYVGAGSAGVIDSKEILKHLYIDTLSIQRAYIDKAISAITVIGDSMKPYVDSDDIVLFYPIDKGLYSLSDGKYIISTVNGIMVKNLTFKTNGNIVISSCNKSYPSEEINKHESQEFLDILGIVVGRVLKS